MKKLMVMFLLVNSLFFVSSVMSAEYCFQDDYIVRAETGDQITSGSMSPAQLAQERIGFPYNAQLTQIRITPQINANNQANQSQRVASIIPQPIDIKAFQGVKVNIQISKKLNCEPCTAQQTGVTESNDDQLINLELCSSLPLNDIKADLVFSRK